VRDDGSRFAPGADGAGANGGLGLRGMRERIEALGDGWPSRAPPASRRRGCWSSPPTTPTPRERLFPAIRAAIRAAARGETVLAPTVATRLVSRMRRPAEEALTSREVEVLELVARGSSNADIAVALFISEATVKTHLLHTFAKLGVDDRTAAVVAALQRGIIALPRRTR
jgi:DNA-binding CsgD family transcriptional regulator